MPSPAGCSPRSAPASAPAFVSPLPVVLAPLHPHSHSHSQSQSRYAHSPLRSRPHARRPPARHVVPRAVASPPANSNASPASTVVPVSPTDSVYDYIIVGAGAAGCVLANRLSASSDASVLLLETGPSKSSFLLNMPLGFPSLLGTDIDAAFVTEPEPHLSNRRLYFPRGRLLGGSHAISVMLYHRGHPHDYQIWNDAAGPLWSPDAVAPYFVKSESQQARDKRRSPVHGVNGPLPVSDLATVNPMTSAFIDAAVSAGLPQNPDFNDWSRDQAGVGQFQVTQRDGTRATPATSYLQQARSRSNLTVRSNSTVQRIIFERDGSAEPVAVAVEVMDDKGRRRTIRANKEIVLASGVYASPQLLMLSGVGPAEHLASHGIPVVHDNPSVGQNLQDHAAVMLTYHSPNPYTDKSNPTTYYTEQTGKSVPILLNYLFRGKGPLTSPMCEAGAFVRTNPDLEACDLQIRFVPFFSEPDPYASLAEFATSGTYLQNKANRPAGFTLQSVVARPRSRGYVQLRSSDVRDSVQIHANWMSNPQDLSTLIEGIKLCRQIAGDDALAPYRGKEQYPGPDISSDEELEKYVRSTCHTANAMVGTCRMGTSEDSVVTPELKVRGVRNLRVIDSSVMPSLPGGQSGAPTMMLAEKGADILVGAAGQEANVSLSESR